ncbi:MAG: electron-transfer flavoprotein:ubiquinone oxidoreductase [Bacteroidota bacterium]|jgi:electron-transferring-flavoprotein dehydrogenase|nr:electron-transfer flavoprotein:ubiquinone oxidoreductase [Bacteroidota bacterium]HHU97841.1 NAD(P)-binding protein [Petrimonas sp.]
MDNVTVKTDVLIIGGGPSGLSFAIRLADLLKEKGLERRILLIDKGNSIGSHIISGALVRPGIFSELLPDTPAEEIPFDSKVSSNKMYMLSERGKLRIPITPPYMGNKGHYTASLGELCRFLANKAEEKGVEIYTGFAMSDILYDEKGKVIGAKTIDTGVDQQGNQMENFQEGTPVEAKLTIFAEGSRGSLTKKLIQKFNLDEGRNQQIYSLGCKELWSVPEGTIAPGEVYNTMGFPASDFGAFGGGFIYGLKDNKIALGLVIGLDYADPTFDTHNAFQVWKKHPFVAQFLKGGTIVEYGAKTLPEGGYYAVPKLFTDNALIVGDSAGLLAMPALKGIHLAVQSGMLAAQTALVALEQNDFSEKTLQTYEQLVKKSTIHSELYRNRNFRQGFVKGMIPGMFHFGTQLITGGAGFCGRLKNHSDSEATKTLADAKKPLFIEKYKDLEFDKELTFDKVTDVYYSGVAHDDHQVPHLQVNDPETFNTVNIKEYGAPCQYYCSAEVYEVHTDREGKQELRIHFENCLHCKTCDIKEPAGGITWNVPYGGNGPDYKYM